VYEKYSTRGEANTARGEAECCICHPSAVFFVHTSKGGALSDILYFLVAFHGAIFLEYLNYCDFGDLAINE